MASEPPAKKQCLAQHFLDLEAVVDNETEESGNDDDEEELFLQDNDVQEDAPQERYTHRKLQSEYDRIMLNEEDWQGMLDRACLRGLRGARVPEAVDWEEDRQQVAPHFEDKLWEIGCRVGKEEVAVFHLMQRVILHNNSFSCLSAFAAHTIPGRIFVEAGTSQQVAEAASGISELILTKMRLVPHEKMIAALSISSSPRPKPQQWVRLLGNTKKLRQYKGDLALVVKVSNTCLLQLWLVPRIQYNNEDSSNFRPFPQLFNADSARSSQGNKSVKKKGKESTVIFQKNEFTSQGYLVLSQKELYICEEGEALPTTQELYGFLGCQALLSTALAETRRRIESSKVEINDRVKVLRGSFRGLLGRVMTVTGDEVEVHLPSQDLIECVRVWELAREFKVGDRVRAKIGSDEMLGWVTMVSGPYLSLFDSAKWNEVTVSTLQTDFYEDERIVPLRCPPSLEIDWKAMKENPHKRLTGKRVMVIGSNHYKGMTGIIQDVTLAGEASVFLDIFNERLARKFNIKSLCLWQGNTSMVIETGDTQYIPTKLAPTIAPTMPIALTPMPSEGETSHNADAWDACALDPEINPDGPVWLTDPVFCGIRIKLRYRANPLPTFLEFLGMENGSVKVRDGTQRKLVPLSSVQTIPPTWKDDIVTSFSLGETYGKLYKIREFHSEFCALRIYGQRAGRSEKNFHVITHELAQVFPPAK